MTHMHPPPRLTHKIRMRDILCKHTLFSHAACDTNKACTCDTPPPRARTQRRCGSGGSTPQGSGSTHQAGANADNRGPRQGGKCGGKGRCKSPARGLSLCQRPDFDSFRVQWALLSDPPNGGGSRSLSRSKARMTCTHPPTHARTHSHTHTQERTHARTHAHTQAHTDARAHARTHR